ncbi:MAG: hypothetical protein VR65_04510 [Desulfobulbaceae bacterium BRH_c16a]|nr:MAG: hypothetical protein VR65_04510 [Desulfobulbaceae bacterium BRH_c16a]
MPDCRKKVVIEASDEIQSRNILVAKLPYSGRKGRWPQGEKHTHKRRAKSISELDFALRYQRICYAYDDVLI